VSWRRSLKSVVEETETPAGRGFDLVVQLLIVLSLISFAVDTLPGLSARTRGILDVMEVVVIALFTVEYAIRVFVADRPLSFILSGYGLIDLLAILPFYLTAGLDLRSVRALRLLRVVRILRIVRYNDAVARILHAFSLAGEELVLFLSAGAILIYVASVGIYYFENAAQPEAFASVFHAMWWAIVTLTTVGYGDVYPVTVGGRIFTAVILVIGLGGVAVPAGILASTLSEARNRQTREAAAVRDEAEEEGE
jgi:voltage-gated potassium channel